MAPTDLKNVLVIGQGSIGQRHVRLLQDRGCSVSIVSAYADGAFRSIKEALAAQPFDCVVVANVTSQHREAVLELHAVGFVGPLLIEKPLCGDLHQCRDMASIAVSFEHFAVGYNLRFHPVVRALKRAIEGQKVFEARVSVGQFLPDWRPGSSFRDGSSARAAARGGVLRDLSHEIDLALYLFGPCERLVASGGNLGRLDIETDETWAIILQMKSGALLQVGLNYYDKPAQRSISLTTGKGSIVGNLIAGSVSFDGQTENLITERNDSYRALHEAMFLRSDEACSIEEAVSVMHVIDAIEISQQEQRWVRL